MEWTIDKRILEFAPTDAGELFMDWSDGTRRVFSVAEHVHGMFMERLLDVDYFQKAHLIKGGSTIEWPEGQDFAPEALYEQSKILEDRATPLPARNPATVWKEGVFMISGNATEEGRLVTQWSDGSRRSFDAWAYIRTGEPSEKFADANFFRQARFSPQGVTWPDSQTFDARTLYEDALILN